DSLITLDTDKASMEVPSPFAGKINKLTVKVCDKVSQGTAIIEVEVESAADQAAPTQSQPQTTSSAPVAATTNQIVDVKVPDIGHNDSVDLI
ncbi:pyruvate dehydrogenase complex dihydrolipoyllysine-residue acetyltransferase, partial [Francisella tularensis subsp. holarctica]|uniref:biotin/lipoyl-containing protein n=1 Tax=Francisella tularensis TaxID=263 RepID=UPI0023ADB02E|nr:pyruvate dehydrogenase complex dihydrolipoyllysine-residue acetyltransferase [Francisella tularensis subsp. holarctica]